MAVARTQRLRKKHLWRGMLVGLETPDHGEITGAGTPIQTLKGDAQRHFVAISSWFSRIQSAVNPRKTVNEIISEPLRHLFCFARV